MSSPECDDNNPLSHIMKLRRGAMNGRALGPVDTLFTQITHATPSASRKKTSLLPVCCLCQLIRDEVGPSLDSARWVKQRTNRKTHGINPADRFQTHTYCPGCFTQVMHTIRAAQVSWIFPTVRPSRRLVLSRNSPPGIQGLAEFKRIGFMMPFR